MLKWGSAPFSLSGPEEERPYSPRANREGFPLVWNERLYNTRDNNDGFTPAWNEFLPIISSLITRLAVEEDSLAQVQLRWCSLCSVEVFLLLS